MEEFRALGLCEELANACAAIGWKSPTKIQSEVIPHALNGKDIIGLAETGSGKTAAFLMPILQALLNLPSCQPFFACILTPNRELALQISQQVEGLGSGIGVRCVTLIGGINMVDQTIALAKRPHIIVATPGRLVDHLSNTKGFNLRTLKYLVLDEADKMLDQDFEEELNTVLQCISKERKTYLFSATMTKKVAKLQRACLKNPVKVEVSTKYATPQNLKQELLLVPSKNKLYGSKIMVFTRTCESTQTLAVLLRNLGLSAVPINGQMNQNKRIGALSKFKAGEREVLICTDVASRGLDIVGVDVVISYDLPSNSKDYIHRAGRTARAGKSGRAIAFVTEYDWPTCLTIEQALGKKLLPLEFREDEVKLLQERVLDAQRITNMQLKEQQGGKKRRQEKADDAEDILSTARKKSFKRRQA